MAPPTLTVSRRPAKAQAPRSYIARAARIEFGDGYAQRFRRGPVRQTLSLKWPPLATADADALLAFLAARGGAEAFYYDVGSGGGLELWSCASWSSSEPTDGLVTVSAEFEREHDIV